MKNKLLPVLIVFLLIPSLSFTAFGSSNFTPSVQAKDAPEIVPQVIETEIIYAEIINKNNEVIQKVTDSGEIIVTPMSEAESSAEDIKQSLENAYKKVGGVRFLTDIVSDLEEIIKKLDPKTSADDLVARDLFNVTTRGNIPPITETNRLRVRFRLGVSPADIVIVAMCEGETDWPVIDAKDVVNNADGTVTVTFSKTGTVLVIVEGAASVPAMSDGFNLKTAAIITAGCMLTFIAAIVIFKPKRTPDGAAR
ncbi:MAG TPA: hypothetical protein PKX70_04110 [Oscillospiraceae bacterium]|nr:hypothetical protein [Oscillospiraceae bacterium]